MVAAEPRPRTACSPQVRRKTGPGMSWPVTVEGHMLYWALVFFIVAVIAAIFGFGGVAATAAGIAKILFFLFVVIFLVTLVLGLGARRGPPPI